MRSIISYYSLYIVSGLSSGGDSTQSTTAQFAAGLEHPEEEGEQEPIILDIHLHPDRFEDMFLSR